MSSRLQLKRDDERRSECPSCGAEMAEGAVICLACGYDKRTGRRADDVPPPRTNPLAIVALALVIVAALGFVIFRFMRSPTRASAPKTVATAPAPASAPPPAPAPAMAAPTQSEAVVAATNPAAPSEAKASATATNVEAAIAPVDMDELEAEQRELATEQLDRIAPLFEKGETVELRLTNGLIERGEFQGRDENELRIAAGSNEVHTVEFISLDRATRTRADPEFRARYIDYHVRQRMHEIAKEREAP